MSTPPPARVGLFGLLGAGNLGNDASMEAVLEYLRRDHAAATIDVLTSDPDRLTRRYGLPATSLSWRHSMSPSGALRLPLLALEKIVETAGIIRWVRRHDVVIVPGMGVLEASLPLRPWETPWALFTLCAAGRLLRTPVALPSVGADPARKRLTRGLLNGAARFAAYVSYRDELSRDAMRERGVDVSRSGVYPDLVVGLGSRAVQPSRPGRTVGLGVMAYYGGNDDDRALAEALHQTYLEGMRSLLRRLVDSSRAVVLFVGDGVDEPVADELVAGLRAERPDLGADAVTARCAKDFAELTEVVAGVDVVVASRYHNVICALRLGTPTISLEYAEKNTAVMRDLGLGDFCHSIRNIDVDAIMEQVEELEQRGAEIRPRILTRLADRRHLLDSQWKSISTLFVS